MMKGFCAGAERECSVASPTIVVLFFRPPCDGIGDPAVDVGFLPSRAVDADFELGRERALSDLAVDGGPGQAGSGKDGVQADDAIWCGHGSAAFC